MRNILSCEEAPPDTPKIELHQLERQTCWKMSIVTPGTRSARYLREFISGNMSLWLLGA